MLRRIGCVNLCRASKELGGPLPQPQHNAAEPLVAGCAVGRDQLRCMFAGSLRYAKWLLHPDIGDAVLLESINRQ